MSVILDALKKAQDERKRPAYRDGGGDEGPPKRPRWIFYVIAGALACAILFVLFLPNLYRTQAPTSPRVAQQKDLPPPPPPSAPTKPSLQEPAVKPPEAPGKGEFSKFVMEPAKSDVGEQAQLERKAKKKAPGPELRVAKSRPDVEPQKPGPKPEKVEQSAGPSAPSPDASVVVKRTTNERLVTNYNNAIQAAEEGRTEEARKLYMAVLADQPDNIEVLNNLGVLAMRDGNAREATLHFRRILDYRKDYAKAYNNLGIITMRDGEKRIAEEYFRKAIEVAPNGIEPYVNLAALLRSEKRLEEANRVLDVPLKKGLRDSQIYLSAALIKDEMGQYEDAVKYYRYYLQTSPQNQERGRVIERITFLEESQSAAGR